MNDSQPTEDEDLGFGANALTVLRTRYLAKNSEGEQIEDPAGMFERVARNIAVVDLLYLPEVYDVSGSQDADDVDPDREDIEDLPDVPHLSEQDVETLWRAHACLAREGKMKVSFSTLCQIARDSEALTDKRQRAFNQSMVERKFMPNSPTLMNAGRELQQLAACFVLPVDDSMESIFDSIKNAALIHKSGGGTGFSFARLRPKNDVVRTTGGIASGPVSFLKVFNSATEAVKQGGTRRGANMGILRVDHPDIEEFIRCKAEDDEVTNFNLSVAITDDFMAKVEADEDYDLVNPRSREVVDRVPARRIFHLIADMAWKNGEPGIIFLDRINDDNPTPELGEVESTNPCGEQPLLPYESCNLGSINLGAFVDRVEWPADEETEIDWNGLSGTVHRAVHFLDNVIDANRYPIPAIRRVTRGNRKIGLGIMGWAEMLIKLGIPYDSERAVNLAERVMGFIDKESKEASAQLAKSRGAFDNYEESIFCGGDGPLRHATTTTIAPTGSISIISGTSSGIEPLFSIAFTRHILDGEKLVEVNPQFEEVAKRQEFYSKDLMERLAGGATLQSQEEVTDAVKEVFVTALDIDPEWHIRMQAAFQAHTDNAVSKTINFPHDATRDKIADSFQQAYKLRCKGLTVYRVGSRQEQVLVSGGADDEKHEKEDAADVIRTNGDWGELRPIPRTSRLRGLTVRKTTPMGNLFLTLNLRSGHPFELFAQIGKAGSDVTAFTEAIARLISLAFRCGVDPTAVADQLIGIGGSRSVGFGPNRVRSVPDAIGQFIQEFVEHAEAMDDDSEDDALTQLNLADLSMRQSQTETDGSSSEGKTSSPRDNYALCPACGVSALVYQEGCVKCVACGYTEC